MPGADVLSPEVVNFVFESVNLLLLAGGLGWFFLKPVRETLQTEQARHQALAAKATAQLDEAERTLAKAREQQATLEEQVEQERAKVLEAAQDQARKIVAAALAEAEHERVHQSQRLAAERRAEIEQSLASVAQIAGKSVAQLLLAAEGPDLQRALVRLACQRLTQSPDFSGIAATVESAQELDSESLTQLREVLSPELTPRVVPELGAGVRITTDAGQVDVTALGIARHAAQQVLRSLELESPSEARDA